ncbi:MAG: cyclic nucleotide-binding domain-containing protein [Pegethrix bostrychoides GSE-TBD4-15B]|jgi:CRP-like cAMP-binding protein|uniref:Cyclic nucleotide-binding domain-containing protein n=1 Tax=Pegethrix bostrychoides GSE-TBD4-15B TaxID=2839662 RepID=A0A951U7F6_9CYAN|nr:cyclic nucleotide-binding domain-containing protein [Pegethrix bostrychoides GSE-TBD4-15B]
MTKALYMLAEFSDRDFDWLLNAGKRKTAAAESILIKQGEPTDALYLVLAGLLVVTASVDSQIASEEIARLGPGEIAGEMSFVDARPPSATVKAAEDSLIWVIPRSKLAAKLLQDAEFASHFYQATAVFLSDRLRTALSQLGYAKAQFAEIEPEVDPQIADNLDLAKARLNWLLNQLRDTP